MQRGAMTGLLLFLAGCGLLAPSTQRYVIFFQEGSADLDDAARGSVLAAAARASDHPKLPVRVSGYADPEGSPQANKYISRLRMQVVADALVADGVPAARIQRFAAGSVDFTMNSLESRRVEIAVGN